MAKKTGQPWTFEELEAAVFGYMLLLELQKENISFSISNFYDLVLSGPLSNRNEAALRYRLRNITHVMNELGLPTLSSFSAASQVGQNVARHLSHIIQSYSSDPLVASAGFDKFKKSSSDDDKRALIDSIHELQSELTQLQRSPMVGHNNPPEGIDDIQEVRKAVTEFSERLASIERAVSTRTPSPKTLEIEQKELISLTAKLFDWGKARVTKFVDAALVTAAPILIVKLTNLTPMIFDVLSKLQRLML